MSDFKPIDKAFAPRKAREWHFKIHPFFTKQPANVVKEYIKHFTKKGALICDPFCGTGVTAIESLTCKRRVFAVDIDPLAVFITKQTCISPTDLDKFQHAFNRISEKMAEKVEFARNGRDKDIEKYKIREWYPKDVRLPDNSDFEFVDQLFDKRQLMVFATLLKEIKAIRDVKTRNLMKLVFSNTLGKANLTYMDNLARGEEGGGSSVFGKYRYWRPKKSKIVDVWKNFERRFYYVKKAKYQCNKVIGSFYEEEKTIWIEKYSATKLSDIVREKSVDYIYTDPPYGAHIAYLDLSTMWNSWLGFAVTAEDRNLEIIEGGDIAHSKEDYLNLLSEAMQEMYKVLKKDAWLSLVFHHKEVRLWHAIRDFAKDAGFEYVNTVAQPTATTSIHKKMNPLKVLGEQLIVNFRKSKKYVPSVQQKGLPVLKVIYNAAEREIIRNGGATLEQIMRGIVPELFESNLIDKVALKTTSDVSDLLANEFDLGMDDKWYIKEENRDKIGHYIDTRDRIRYYLISLLRREKRLDFDMIVTTLLPLLENGRQPTPKEILKVLEEVGISKDKRTWELRSQDQIAFQQELALDKAVTKALKIPKGTRHNQILYRLLALGKKLNFSVYVGKRERSIDPAMFKGLKILKDLPFGHLTSTQKKRIEGIDCIWFHKGDALFAFEVESSTTILSALERFYSLLEVCSQIGHDRRLVVVAPISRKRKLFQELTHSSYVGHPNRLEQKIVYLYFESLMKQYPILLQKDVLGVDDIDRLLTPANNLNDKR